MHVSLWSLGMPAWHYSVARDLHMLCGAHHHRLHPQVDESSFLSAARGEAAASASSAASGGSVSGADSATIAQLKAQLERMNSQLREEERLAESEKRELLQLQV